MDARYYRGLTEKSKQENARRQQATRERERAIQKAVDDIVSKASAKAERAARACETRVCIAEFQVLRDTPERLNEIIKRLITHFQNKGFNTGLVPDRTYRPGSRYQFEISW